MTNIKTNPVLRPLQSELKDVLPILQGLLASGHYTEKETDIDPPCVIRTDNGTDWKEDGWFARRYTANAIEDAISLAEELIRQMDIERKKTL